jgi:hypothetical protein
MLHLHRSCSRGLQLELPDEETDNKFREPFFNFYDERLMGLAWADQPNPDVTAHFFRLLALCHTVIPDGVRAAHPLGRQQSAHLANMIVPVSNALPLPPQIPP